MMTDIESIKVDEFWGWFCTQSDWLADVANRREAPGIARLEDRIATLINGATWEIGPGVTARHSFVLSPNRNLKLLPLTRFVVGRAPPIAEWEFHAARPRKQWHFRFNMFNRSGQRLAIDASDWRYSLIAYDKRSFFDLTLHAKNLPKMDEVSCRQASWIVVEGAIGEDLALDRLGMIKMNEQKVVIPADQTGRIDHLYDHIVELVNETAPSSHHKV
jgi:hypothetical protein